MGLAMEGQLSESPLAASGRLTGRDADLGGLPALFCWSEVGTEAVATLLSLMVTCRLSDIDPYQ